MAGRFDQADPTLNRKFFDINWMFVVLLTAIASIGFAMLYSAAKGNMEPWATTQMIRFGIGVGIMTAIALIDIRFWYQTAYWALGITVVLLLGVELVGQIRGGAQRWINVGPFNLQPSEIAKFTLVLALSKYYHSRTSEEVLQYRFLAVPLLLIAVPAGLILVQPDLGTSIILVASGVGVLFLAGAPKRLFIYSFLAVVGSLPIAWQFMHNYQKLRVLTFLDPSRDTLGAGYHITQSKIALGSGGLTGKGFMQGTQSQLEYLPEKQTDFVFSMLGEEFGMLGGLVLLCFYTMVLIYGYAVGMRSTHAFGRYLAVGVTSIFFLYFFINMAMVMGMLPVVGLPLPLVSYGGTAMISLMAGFGLIINVYVHRDVMMSRRGEL